MPLHWLRYRIAIARNWISLASATKLTPNHLVASRFRPMLFPYFRDISTTIEDLDSRHRDLSGTASIIYYGTRSWYKRDRPRSIVGGGRTGGGRTVERFRMPTPAAAFQAQAFTPERSPRCQMAICRPRPKPLVLRLLIRKRQSPAIHFLSAIFHRLRSNFVICNIHET
jgi:hypothetical protein